MVVVDDDGGEFIDKTGVDLRLESLTLNSLTRSMMINETELRKENKTQSRKGKKQNTYVVWFGADEDQ